MDILWSPWRYDYIKSGSSEEQRRAHAPCVFCAIQEETGDDESRFILHRARYNFVVLNIYPYISGHLLIVPYAHMAELDAAPKETTDELMDLTKRSQTLLREAYHPHGFNLGMNLGRAAGAGVAEHIHLHIMPRWTGDSNFMSTIGETRVIPEDLKTTYHKLHGKF
ncbi:MAG TPA: HIT domain-containing protein [Pyrinomonadaceae bacterium]